MLILADIVLLCEFKLIDRYEQNKLNVIAYLARFCFCPILVEGGKTKQTKPQHVCHDLHKIFSKCSTSSWQTQNQNKLPRGEITFLGNIGIEYV